MIVKIQGTQNCIVKKLFNVKPRLRMDIFFENSNYTPLTNYPLKTEGMDINEKKRETRGRKSLNTPN